MAAEVDSLRAVPRRRPAAWLRSVFALLLLPLSIAPVLLLGPSVLRAPVVIWLGAWADIQHLERRLQPASHGPRPAPIASGLGGLPTVSLGMVYGRWSAFPQAGRMQPGDSLLGPEGWT